MVCAVAVAAVAGDAVVSRPKVGGAKHRLGDDGSSRDCRFATTRLLGRQTAKQIQQTTVDLKSQFESAGNFTQPQFRR